MSSSPGYIPIWRKFFDHYLWNEKREYSKAEAWIDCIQMARYKKTTKKQMMGGNLITWGYGQFPASVRYLRERWGWKSNGRVTRFLEILQKDSMIELKTEQGQNIITLCNYSIYDIRENPNGTATEQQRNTDGTATEQNSKNDNNGKNEKKESAYPFSSFWNDYEKKTDKKRSQQLYNKIPEPERINIQKHIPQYKAYQPDSRYRKDPTTYLRGENWKDEIIKPGKNGIDISQLIDERTY